MTINFKKWKKQTIFAKIITIVEVVLSISIMVLVILGLTGAMKNADNIFMPLLGVCMLIQAIQNWKKEKIISVFSILVAMYIFIVAILKFIRI